MTHGNKSQKKRDETELQEKLRVLQTSSQSSSQAGACEDSSDRKGCCLVQALPKQTHPITSTSGLELLPNLQLLCQPSTQLPPGDSGLINSSASYFSGGIVPLTNTYFLQILNLLSSQPLTSTTRHFLPSLKEISDCEYGFTTPQSHYTFLQLLLGEVSISAPPKRHRIPLAALGSLSAQVTAFGYESKPLGRM